MAAGAASAPGARKNEMGISALLAEHERKDLLRFVTAGSVDDGKSTLIGRLLYESQGLYEDQLESVRRLSRAGPDQEQLDLALVTDGLKAEREQRITIDVAYRHFSTPRRKFIIADTPGHEQYTRNMATGASTANLIVILLDAEKGVLTQSKRHAFIAALLGIPHAVVAVNKMDLVGYREARFRQIVEEFTGFAAKLEIGDLAFIPVSALRGDNVVAPSREMPWYKGSTLLNHLETVHIASDRNLIDLRFPIQYVLRPDRTFRGYLGTMASGVIRPGDAVMVIPSGLRTRVKTVFGPDGELAEAWPPLSVGVTLADEIDISRGDMLVHVHNTPHVARQVEAMLVWMSPEPLELHKTYLVKHTTRTVNGAVSILRYRVDVNTLHRVAAEGLKLNEIGRCELTLSKPIPFDPYQRNRATGAFILIDRLSNNTVAAGMIISRERHERLVEEAATPSAPRSTHLAVHASQISPAERATRLGHQPATIWLTGLTGSGKSSIAYALERRLFEAGCTCLVLDGENTRRGLSKDLAFTADDRAENIRRAAELARLLNDAGQIALCAYLSPTQEDREMARRIVGPERFLEVYLSAPLAICRQRRSDLYTLAERGEVEQFTGLTSPYEPPAQPELTLPTHELPIEACVERVVTLLQTRGVMGREG
jgi:bifunctional enzyme CysN/CysC